MNRSFAYYPGCALHGSAREYDVSTRLVCRALGVELREIEDWVCCGASSAHTQSRLLSVALSAAALQAAARMGLPLLAPCAMCFSRFRQAAQELGQAGLRQQVAGVLQEEIGPLPPILHPLQVLDEFAPALGNRLAGLRVASYYGCLLVRSPQATGIDDPENPTIMDRIVTRLGAEPVPWAFKTECCGAGMALPLPRVVKRLSARLLSEAREVGAEAVVVACPMCQANLDLYTDRKTAVPVLYITQLVGLALGFSPQELLLGRHLVSPLPILKAKGLAGNGEDRGLSVSLRP